MAAHHHHPNRKTSGCNSKRATAVPFRDAFAPRTPGLGRDFEKLTCQNRHSAIGLMGSAPLQQSASWESESSTAQLSAESPTAENCSNFAPQWPHWPSVFPVRVIWYSYARIAVDHLIMQPVSLGWFNVGHSIRGRILQHLIADRGGNDWQDWQQQPIRSLETRSGGSLVEHLPITRSMSTLGIRNEPCQYIGWLNLAGQTYLPWGVLTMFDCEGCILHSLQITMFALQQTMPLCKSWCFFLYFPISPWLLARPFVIWPRLMLLKWWLLMMLLVPIIGQVSWDWSYDIHVCTIALHRGTCSSAKKCARHWKDPKVPEVWVATAGPVSWLSLETIQQTLPGLL